MFTRARRTQPLNDAMTMRHFLDIDQYSNCSNMWCSTYAETPPYPLSLKSEVPM